MITDPFALSPRDLALRRIRELCAEYGSALVVPLFDQVRAWCSQQGLQIKSEAEMASHPKVRELIEHEVKRFNRLFGSWEQVKKVALVADLPKK